MQPQPPRTSPGPSLARRALRILLASLVAILIAAVTVWGSLAMPAATQRGADHRKDAGRRP